MKNNKYILNKKGITLVALVITIIVLLILAGVSISMLTRDDGIIEKAIKAKEETEIAGHKEIIGKAAAQAKLNSGNNTLTIDGLRNELSRYDAEIYDDIGSIVIKFENRYYEITEDGEIIEIEVSGPKDLIVQCVDSQGNVLLENQFVLMRNNFSMKAPQIEGYEASNQIIEKTITESTTIKHLYYKIFNDDTTIVFTGFNASGNITNIESEIVSYIVGDNATNNGNGLKEKVIQGILIIPDTYKDKPVVEVGKYAFRGSNNIIKVDIGDNVTSIHDFAFGSNNLLKEVVLGKSVIEYFWYPFSYCSNLKTVVLKGTRVDPGHFVGSNNWSEIKLSEDNVNVKVIDNILYSEDGKTILACPIGRVGKFIVPVGVEKIGEKAFSNSNIEVFDTGENLKSIGMQAFNSSNVKEIIIRESVNEIGGYAFIHCYNLKTITLCGFPFNPGVCAGSPNWTEVKLSENNNSIQVIDNVVYSLDGETLLMCPTGKSGEFVIPSNVKYINSSAFSGNNSLTKVVIPDGVETIEGYLFHGVSSLSEIIIGEKVKTVGAHAFTTASGLKTVVIKSNDIASQLISKEACNCLINVATTIYIRNDITNIGSYVQENYSIQESDRDGYIKYVKN